MTTDGLGLGLMDWLSSTGGPALMRLILLALAVLLVLGVVLAGVAHRARVKAFGPGGGRR